MLSAPTLYLKAVTVLWVLLAITGAIANAAFYIIIKRYITVLDPRVLTAAGFIFGALLLFSLSALQGFPIIGPEYYSAVAVSAVLNIVGLTLIFSALTSSDLSLSMPMLSFTPGVPCWHFLCPPERSAIAAWDSRDLCYRERVVHPEYLRRTRAFSRPGEIHAAQPGQLVYAYRGIPVRCLNQL